MILGAILVIFGFLLNTYLFFDLIGETRRQAALDRAMAAKCMSWEDK